MKKKNPFVLPKISCYAKDNALFGLLLTKNEQTHPWIYNNYVNLEIRKDDWYFTDFTSLEMWNNCPWIIRHNIPHKFVNELYDGVGGFIKFCLNSGYYCFFNIDQFYIPIYPNYEKHHSLHEIMVYGYDQNSIYFCEFTNGQRAKEYSCSFDELHKGFEHNMHEYDYLSGIDILALRDYPYFEFDINKLYRDINDYRHSRCSISIYDIYPGNLHKRNGTKYGLDIYIALNDLLETMKIDKNINIDYRPFQVEYFHKVLMEQRIRYLSDQGYIDKESTSLFYFQNLINICLTIRNLVLKIRITKDSSSISKIQNMLMKCHKLETQALDNLLKELDKCKK